MTPEELADELRTRGLNATTTMPGELTVSRNPDRPHLTFLNETITLKNGYPYWSWGQEISDETVEDAAETVDSIVSLPGSVSAHS